MVPFTITIPSMGHYNSPMHDQKWEKKLKNRFLDLSLHKPSFHTKCISWAKNNVQLSLDIIHNALQPHDPTKMTHRPS
jgi:hypothetical protein